MLTRANAKYSCAPAPGLPAEPQKFAVSLCSLHLQSPHGDRRYRAQLCQIARLGQSPADRVPETRRSLCNRTLAQHKLKPRFDGPVVSLSVVCGVRWCARARAGVPMWDRKARCRWWATRIQFRTHLRLQHHLVLVFSNSTDVAGSSCRFCGGGIRRNVRRIWHTIFCGFSICFCSCIHSYRLSACR